MKLKEEINRLHGDLKKDRARILLERCVGFTISSSYAYGSHVHMSCIHAVSDVTDAATLKADLALPIIPLLIQPSIVRH